MQVEDLQQSLSLVEDDEAASAVQRSTALVKSTSSGLVKAISEWMEVMSRREEVRCPCVWRREVWG